MKEESLFRLFSVDDILYILSMVKKILACNTEKSLRVALHGENS